MHSPEEKGCFGVIPRVKRRAQQKGPLNYRHRHMVEPRRLQQEVQVTIFPRSVHLTNCTIMVNTSIAPASSSV